MRIKYINIYIYIYIILVFFSFKIIINKLNMYIFSFIYCNSKGGYKTLCKINVKFYMGWL